jgi:hypothetical protein
VITHVLTCSAYEIYARPHAMSRSTVDLVDKELVEINIYIQTLQRGANDRSAQELQNALYNEAHANFLTEIWTGKVCIESI